MADAIAVQEAEEIAEEQFDTSDTEQVKKAKKRAARTRADRLRFVEAAMKHPEGRAWFNDLLVFCRVFNVPYDPDPYRTAFLCGQQNIGLNILADIQDAAPEQYITMVNENRKKNG